MADPDEKWLIAETYFAAELVEPKDRISEAQWLDSERRGGGVCSVEIKTGWAGSAQQITNRGLESELTITLSREQTAALVPVLIFEARFAVEGAGGK